MKDFVKIGIKRKKIHSNHSEVPELFQKNVLEIIESFTKTVVKRKIFQTNHSENGCVLQKSVLGIVKTVYFSKKMYLVLCGQLFYRSSKNLATLPVIIEPLFTESNKNSIGKQHKN